MKITRKAGKIDALRSATAVLNGAEGKVGWFESAKYPSGAPVAGVAQVQEFGSPARKIPPRPFFRTTVTEKQNDWAATSKQLAQAAVRGDIAANKMIPALCLAAEGHVRATITKLIDPPLKQSTIAARKRKLANGGVGAKSTIGKPLVETGILLNTLTSQVGKE